MFHKLVLGGGSFYHVFVRGIFPEFFYNIASKHKKT